MNAIAKLRPSLVTSSVSRFLRKAGIGLSICAVLILGALGGCDSKSTPSTGDGGDASLSDAEIENLVKRSYQYVAMYNVNNKFAIKQGGWNTVDADTELKDHTMREIARPNNDTLYISALIDLRKDPVILEMPAFDSDYVSLMVTGYDHYVNVPMATRLGDFKKPENILFYTERPRGTTASLSTESIVSLNARATLSRRS